MFRFPLKDAAAVLVDAAVSSLEGPREDCLKEIRCDQSSLDAFKLVLETVRSEALGTAFIQTPSGLGKQSPAIAAGTGVISVDAIVTGTGEISVDASIR